MSIGNYFDKQKIGLCDLKKIYVQNSLNPAA